MLATDSSQHREAFSHNSDIEKGLSAKNMSYATSTLTKKAGDISSVFPSLSGKPPPPLPSRYSNLKKKLVQGREEAASRWSPPPDFPGAGGDGEKDYLGKVDWSSNFIDSAAKRAMGFAGQGGFEIMPHMSAGEQNIVRDANRVLFGR